MTIHDYPAFPPFRICCGQQHASVTCPDGLTMCALCFDRFPIAALATHDGHPIDICTPCLTADIYPIGA